MSDQPLPDRLVDPDDAYPATLDEAVYDELVLLWADLADARRNAANGCWSVGCENITYRIVALTRHIGAVGWEDVDAALTRSGLYERIHREAGLEHPPVNWYALAAYEQRIGRASC